MLVIEIEFLTGVSVAASPHRREQPEWPPHPDRVFQALVASWGRNDPPDEKERQALEWFEQLNPNDLEVSAPPVAHRTVATTYVPPNDAFTTGKPGAKVPKQFYAALRVVPEFRKNRQPRAFPAVLPISDRKQVHYKWQLNEEKTTELAEHLEHLKQLAREVTYLGHSHTLVRMAVLEQVPGHAISGLAWIKADAAVRVPYAGRLEHLCEQFAEFSRSPVQVFRPRPSLKQRVFERQVDALTPAAIFEGDTAIVLADAGGFVPALPTFPLVAKRLRDALLDAAPKGSPVPSVLSGHNAEGRPSAEPHMAIVPLADVGWQHSQGRLMGVALLWPRQVPSAERQAAVSILASFLRSDSNTRGLLHFGRNGSWALALDLEADRASRRLPRYIGPARRWGTVLPTVLDRHPKPKPGEGLPSIVAQACINIGLPKEAVDGMDVQVHKYAAVRSAPSVRDVWRCLPNDSPYRSRPLAHLVLTFASPVTGPIIIGAGRYRGLGLCLALNGGDPK